MFSFFFFFFSLSFRFCCGFLIFSFLEILISTWEHFKCAAFIVVTRPTCEEVSSGGEFIKVPLFLSLINKIFESIKLGFSTYSDGKSTFETPFNLELNPFIIGEIEEFSSGNVSKWIINDLDFAITILHRTCVRNMCQKTFA